MPSSARAAAAAASGVLSFFMASDTHLGHDVACPGCPGNVTTSLYLNTQFVLAANALSLNESAAWPAVLGGGPVLPPRALVISGDLVDNGYTESYEWRNWTRLFGLDGTDGLLTFPVYEGRGNHDGGNSSDPVEPHFVASEIVARNQLRAGTPAFNLTGVSSETGLHYSWAWAAGPGCTAHFVMLNEYAGHTCDGCSPAPSCFYGPTCYTGWTYPEDSLGFLEAVLPRAVGASGSPVFVIQHYCFDGYSNAWYSAAQRLELYRTLEAYNVAGVICGHTHSAAHYYWNGTDTGDTPGPGWIDVYNVPSTQKESGTTGAPEPPEWLVGEVAAAGDGTARVRVAHRVGGGWGTAVLASKTMSCSA